ncbi:MAG: cupredoxin domain-containing protein [Chloroflexota bacterium]
MRNSLVFWLLFGIAALLVAFAPLPALRIPPVERVFRIEASQYAYSPGEIRVNPGDTVTIELVSTDVVHGLYLDGYGLSVQADPGQTARLTFTADKPGSFRFRCNVTCGAMHPFMIGKLHVGQNSRLWRGIGLALLAAIASIAYFVLRSSPLNTEH